MLGYSSTNTFYMLMPTHPTEYDIIDAIIQHYSLSIGGIIEHLQKKGKDIPERNIYYHIEALFEKGIIAQYKQNYTITSLYDRKLSEFQSKVHAATLNNKQFNQKIMTEIVQKGKVKMSFNSAFEYENTMAELCYMPPIDQDAEHEFSYTYHYAYLLTPQGKAFLEFTKQNHYNLSVCIAGNTETDKIAADLLLKYGHNVRLVSNSTLSTKNTEICIWGKKFIMKVFYSDNYRHQEEELLNKSNKNGLSNDYLQFFKKKKKRQDKIIVTMESNLKEAQIYTSSIKRMLTI